MQFGKVFFRTTNTVSLQMILQSLFQDNCTLKTHLSNITACRKCKLNMSFQLRYLLHEDRQDSCKPAQHCSNNLYKISHS
jgi:hypothetical protein